MTDSALFETAAAIPATGEQLSTQPTELKTETANIEPISANADIESDEWRGDARYFQTGKKAGKLKPSAAVSGIDAATSTAFDGLNTDALRASVKPTAAAPTNAAAVKVSKAEKKAGEARIGAAMAMRFLDMLTGFISGNTFGADFNAEQKKARNTYREELENDWREYLLTLDIPMHPALVALLSSAMYVAPAFDTQKGSERAQSLKSKLIGWTIGRFF